MSEDTKGKKEKAVANPRAAMVAKARAMILKTTGQKPLQGNVSPMGVVSTGSFPVDMLIGGRPAKDGKGLICPGFPRRHITEVYGPESSGKTTLLISAMVEAQKAGGMCMFIDFEHSLDHAYAKAIGLDYDENKLLCYQPDSMEDGFKMMQVGIMAGYDLIAVDSVAGMVPKDELAKNFDDPAKIGAVARQFSKELPRFVLWLQKYPQTKDKKRDEKHQGTALVFINQNRALIQQGGHGGDENTAGGKALKYFYYLRLRLSRIKSEFVERKDPVSGKKRRFAFGNVTDVKIVKTKVDGTQGHSTQMFIRYGTGIDDYFSVIEAGVTQRVIKRDGAFYSLGDQRFQGKETFRKFLVANPKVFDALKLKVAQAVNTLAAVPDLEEDDELSEDFDLDLDADESTPDIEEVIGAEGDAGEGEAAE